MSLKGLEKKGKKLHLHSDNSPSRPQVTSESEYFQLPGRRRNGWSWQAVGGCHILKQHWLSEALVYRETNLPVCCGMELDHNEEPEAGWERAAEEMGTSVDWHQSNNTLIHTRPPPSSPAATWTPRTLQQSTGEQVNKGQASLESIPHTKTTLLPHYQPLNTICQKAGLPRVRKIKNKHICRTYEVPEYALTVHTLCARASYTQAHSTHPHTCTHTVIYST